jgi:hypothetical protein
VRFAGEEDEQEDNVIAEVAVPSQKKSFFMMDDGSQEDQLWNVVALPQFEERGIGDSKPMPKPVKRASCWHCLRFYAEETGVEFKHPDITTKVRPITFMYIRVAILLDGVQGRVRRAGAEAVPLVQAALPEDGLGVRPRRHLVLLAGLPHAGLGQRATRIDQHVDRWEEGFGWCGQ